ncbi:MAG TPA: transaldolase [Acidimicrobiales bacterium]|nr:transaldolase [Acidimicrobiales bacterium]
MSRLHELFERGGQSPWLDNLKRGYITSGELQRWVDLGIRGITSNPSIFEKAISGGADYEAQFRSLLESGASIEDSYWQLVSKDIMDALAIMRPVYDDSNGVDGFVSIEVDPTLARDTSGTIKAAQRFHSTIEQPNLYVKIPATAEGVPAIRQMISEGRSINVTLIFSLDRYVEVIEAYLDGLEAFSGDLSSVASVASFFVSRVDTEVDRRLEAIGSPAALAARGTAAVAQAQVAYSLFTERFRGARWDRLAARGARVQRPLWASTSTKNPAFRDTLYVDTLIGPDTVNTLPEATIEAFEDHGTVARTVDADLDGARAALDRLRELGIDLDDVSRVLEDEGVSAFVKSFDEVLTTLGDSSDKLRTR